MGDGSSGRTCRVTAPLPCCHLIVLEVSRVGESDYFSSRVIVLVSGRVRWYSCLAIVSWVS